MALYDETMAPGYAHWRTPHPQLLDSLVVDGAVRAESSVLELDAARVIIFALFVKERVVPAGAWTPL